MNGRPPRRRIVLLVVSLALLLAFLAAFLNLTETDAILRQLLRAFVPQQVQDVLRPMRAPMVIGFSPEWEDADVPLRSPVTITFLTPMNAAATEDKVTIDPAVAGEFSWRGATLVFTPSEDWPMETEIAVSVDRDARSWLMRRMERGFAYSFTTLGPPSIVATEPSLDARYVYLRDQLTITFNRPMDRESVERRLSISPEVPGWRLVWGDERLTISGELNPLTEYQVLVGRGARDSVHGMRLTEDFEWTFVTTERHPYLAITGLGMEALVTAGESTALELGLVNVSRIDLDLYPIDVSSYLAMASFSAEDWRQFRLQEAPLLSWSIDAESTPDRDETQDLELEALDPGLYFLVAQSPEGARDSQILVSTRTALTLKRTPSQALAWATSVEDGQPVAGLALTVYDESGNVLATGATDEEGIFSTDLPDQTGRLHILAEGEGGLSVCSDAWDEGFEPWRFEDVTWRWASQSRLYRVFLYTDRPAYAPGEMVNFRGVLRLDRDGVYTVPSIGTAVQVTASNYKGNVIYDAELETSPFGTIHGAFALNDEVEPGEYLLEAVVEGEAHQTLLRIQDYEEQRFSVGVTSDREEYLTGDVITVTVSAEYDFGVPVAGAMVDYMVYGSDYGMPLQVGDIDYGSCDGFACSADTREVAAGRGIINEEGEFRVLLRADVAPSDRSHLLNLEATVTDAGGAQVTGHASLKVHRGEFYIGLLPKRSVISRGQQAAVDVLAVDTDGQRLGNLDLFYTVSVSEWQEVPRTVQGTSYWDWRELISEVESSRITTDEEGQATVSFVPQQGGVYRLEAWGRDDSGNRVISSVELWVSDPNRSVAWRFPEQDRIQLVADKQSYRPDETAKVLVQSPYESAVALVTVERSGILSYDVSDLRGNSPVLEIPLEAGYAPNVFVSVVLVSGDGIAVVRPGFKVGYAELRVQSPEEILHVSVIPDEESYEPGQMASYTIRTRDYMDRPVSAEVSLGVVDTSSFVPSAETTVDLVEAFHGRRQLSVRTAQSLAVHAGRKRDAEGYGSGVGEGEQKPQSGLPEVAYWNPAIVTDERGMARVTFQMPRRPATWRAIARGVTVDGLVGGQDVEVSSSQPLVMIAGAPRFLYVGDEAVIGALIENHTADALQARVTLTTVGGLSAAENPRTVVIEAGERVTVDWTVQALEAGHGTLTMVADAENVREVVQSSVSILPFGERTVVLDAIVVQGDASRTLSVPEGAKLASLELDIAPSLAAAVIESVEHLSDQPHRCTEQTVSSFLPGLAVSQVLSQQGIDSDQLVTDLPGLVTTGLQRLYRLQNLDGGWGWSGGDESQPSQTAYVVLGLVRARKAGYEVNERVLNKGLSFLQHSVLETRDLEARAYISHVLAECGEGDLSLARSLSERRRRMDLYAQGYLALALDALGDRSSAQQIVEDLTTEVVETAHTAHWTEEHHDLAAMSSDGRTTAVVLRAMLAVDPDNPLVSKAVQWLMWSWQGGHWGTTHETAQVVLALSRYLDVADEGGAGLSYRAYLNEELLVSGTVTPQDAGAPGEVFTSDLDPGDNRLEVVTDGPGIVYVASALQYLRQTDSLEAVRPLNGPIVRRQYELLESGEPVSHCRVGDLIRVRLTIEFADDAFYVVVEDAIPPGMEAVDIRPQATVSGEGGYVQLDSCGDLRDGRITFYATGLAAGVYDYTYLVRATIAGQFRVAPAEVMLMYEPAVWGNSASHALRIDGR